MPLFEKTVAAYCEAKYAVAVNSATSALHIACLALGVGKNDLVWTTPVTFVASANCALYCGADIDFVDIDPLTYNLSVEKLALKLAFAKKQNRLPKVVVVVHLCGQSCDMLGIYSLSQQYGFKVIEDASHAIGGKYQGNSIGNCQYSDITVFSFHPVKIITTAEGGMALTNDEQLSVQMELLRSHGITRDKKLMTHESDGEWYYQQVTLGFNYRMTELQAALGVSQMKRLDSFVMRRHELVNRYNHLLEDLPVKLPYQLPDAYSAFHLYVIRLDLPFLKRSHKQVFSSLREQGIGVNLHYIPVHTQPFYSEMGFKYGDFPESESYYSQAISIPMFATMTDDQQDQVVLALKVALGL